MAAIQKRQAAHQAAVPGAAAPPQQPFKPPSSGLAFQPCALSLVDQDEIAQLAEELVRELMMDEAEKIEAEMEAEEEAKDEQCEKERKEYEEEVETEWNEVGKEWGWMKHEQHKRQQR